MEGVSAKSRDSVSDGFVSVGVLCFRLVSKFDNGLGCLVIRFWFVCKVLGWCIFGNDKVSA